MGDLIKYEDDEMLVLKRSEGNFMCGLNELPSGKKGSQDKT